METQEVVKATTRTTLELDAHYFPVRVITAREAFTSMFRRRHSFLNGGYREKVPFLILDKQLQQYEGKEWVEGRDELLKEGYPVLRSCKGYWPVPTIIIVNTFYKHDITRRRRSHKPSFRELLEKHNYTCAITGKHYPPDKYNPRDIFNIDHIIPRSLGGPSDEVNLVLSEKTANTKKADLYPYTTETGEELKAILRSDFFPELNLHGVKYRDEWNDLLFNKV